MKGQIDFGIVAIREDEFSAVLQRFPKIGEIEGQRRYILARCETTRRNTYQVAIVRAIAQGNLTSEDLTRDLIDDLDPNWLVLVGIAGGMPSDDFSLGDVVLATRLVDYTVGALMGIAGHMHEFSSRGGPMNREIENLLATLKAKDDELRGWNSRKNLGMSLPSIDVLSRKLYGPKEWRDRVKKSLMRSLLLPQSDRPKYTTGPIISSDNLIKDPELVTNWIKYGRDVLAVEMELAGVYVAARRLHREYPILAVRGISDIVGFKREAAWTSVACQSAASFAHALIKTEPVEPRAKGFSGITRKSVKQKEVTNTFCDGAASVTYCAATVVSPTTISPESLTIQVTKEGRFETVITDPGFEPGSKNAKIHYAQTLFGADNDNDLKIAIEVDKLPIKFQVHIMKNSASYWESATFTRILETRERAAERLRKRIRHYLRTQAGLRGSALEELVDRSMKLIEG